MNPLARLRKFTSKRNDVAKANATHALTAEEINKHVELAVSKTKEATHHALAASELLESVKGAIPSGQWDAWVQTNIKNPL